MPQARVRRQSSIFSYVPHLPAAGEILYFDRSWYSNRAAVEKVMGVYTDAHYREFVETCPEFKFPNGIANFFCHYPLPWQTFSPATYERLYCQFS